MKRALKQFFCFLFVVAMMSNSIVSNAQEKPNLITTEVSQNLILSDSGVTINGTYYTQDEFKALLDSAVRVDSPNEIQNSKEESAGTKSAVALVAGTWWIPGIGQVVVTVAGTIIIAGVVVGVGTWLYNAVVEWFETRAYNKSVDDAIGNCNSNKQNHILNDKHNWNKLTPDPKWSTIVPFLEETLKKGRAVREKVGQYLYTYTIDGETVQVRVMRDAQGLIEHIGTAWVK